MRPYEPSGHPPEERSARPRRPVVRRWMGRLVPPMMAVGVLALAGVTFPSRSEAGPVPGMSECLLRPPAAQSRGGAAAVRVEALMSARGEHMGRRVEVTTARGVPVTLSLARESFVGSPGVGRMVYGQATADGSEVRAIDLQSGCDVRLHASREVAARCSTRPQKRCTCTP